MYLVIYEDDEMKRGVVYMQTFLILFHIRFSHLALAGRSS